jgi:hypothetical protein
VVHRTYVPCVSPECSSTGSEAARPDPAVHAL